MLVTGISDSTGNSGGIVIAGVGVGRNGSVKVGVGTSSSEVVIKSSDMASSPNHHFA